MPEFFSEVIVGFLGFVNRMIMSYWWLIAIPFLALFLLDLWRAYVSRRYKKSIRWTMLEIHIPREVEQTPKAMEQVFSALHSIQSSVTTWDKWLKGKVENWMTLEMVGTSSGINFYMRIPSDFRDLAESALYSQYPDSEISIVDPEDDYIKRIPSDIPNGIYDLTGSEFILAKEDAYPIKTYEYFDDKEEERRIDPISIMTEVMSKLEGPETILMQLIVKPVSDDWVKDGKKVIKGIMEGEKKKKSAFQGTFDGLVEFIHNFLKAFWTPPEWSGSKDDASDKDKKLTEGERNIIKAIENKMSKLNFSGALRFLYIDEKVTFAKENVSSFNGALKLFNTNDMNSLKANKDTSPAASGFNKEKKIENKKKKIFSIYKLIDFPKKSSIFSTEELATLYHFPITSVKSPRLSKQMFRKGGPPSNLPLIG